MNKVVFAVGLLCILCKARGDTPANCTYEDVTGSWTFQEGNRNHGKTLNCSDAFDPIRKIKVEFLFPDVAIDQYGHKGRWTVIYNQGFEFVINERKYFAFSKYKQQGSNITSICDRTSTGWSHDTLGHNWACYSGSKDTSVPAKHHTAIAEPPQPGRHYRYDYGLVTAINDAQDSWTAKVYPQYEKMTRADMMRRAGGRNSKIYQKDEQCRTDPGCYRHYATRYEYSSSSPSSSPPYAGKDDQCRTDPGCYRHYATRYEYVGGFYGVCNEALMRRQLVKNGPMSVSFMVYSDFMHYAGGIYHHTALTDRYNPLELTNHAVLLVGYGYDHRTLEKYWTVKNSWGEEWGERGYFRIRRGVDEVAIESVAVESFPIP
ncbi:PREDICTED: dipeptidyl peptidase 1-like [Priapulus caudatus]|uniref:dipeptidyl-peptidase I n=1 Tax=Priapulus caudatus TaxID=37621 RepID=A0ABM1E848_PRICU|nr:PREDICTED: dipeptidyl peptidase 1-like [Priapulus caudatus]